MDKPEYRLENETFVCPDDKVFLQMIPSELSKYVDIDDYDYEIVYGWNSKATVPGKRQKGAWKQRGFALSHKDSEEILLFYNERKAAEELERKQRKLEAEERFKNYEAKRKEAEEIERARLNEIFEEHKNSFNVSNVLFAMRHVSANREYSLKSKAVETLFPKFGTKKELHYFGTSEDYYDSAVRYLYHECFYFGEISFHGPTIQTFSKNENSIPLLNFKKTEAEELPEWTFQVSPQDFIKAYLEFAA